MERIETTIDRLGHLGDGIAPGPLFAPMTLPGERVSGVPDGARLTDVRIIAPSALRVTAPCPHYRACGGCVLQHADDAFVAEWKRDVVRQALAAHGMTAEFLPVITAPARSRRRASFSARRTKKGALAGFHARASDTVIEVPDCRVLRPDLVALLPLAEALAVLGSSRKGELSVQVTLSEGGPDVAVTGGKPLDSDLRSVLGTICDRDRLARIAWDGEVVALRSAPVQRLGAARVVPPPGGFLQATIEGEAALLAVVKSIVAGAARVVDLFAGCGTFALPLADRAEVHAVEGDAGMTAALDRAWRDTTGLHRVTVETRDLFRRPLLPDELARFDAAVIDPPRAGAEQQVMELARARVRRVAMVSCNPVTFARDVAVLTRAGYVLGPVQVVDQFRWSPHVELVAGLTLAAG